MKLTKQQEQALAELAPAAQAALESGDPAQAQQVVKNIHEVGGVELLRDIWDSGK